MGNKLALLSWILLLAIYVNHGKAKPQPGIGVGNPYFVVPNPGIRRMHSPFGFQFVTRKRSRNPTMTPMAQTRSSESESISITPQVYILRRKVPNQQKKPLSDLLTSNSETDSSFAIPILSQNQERRIDPKLVDISYEGPGESGGTSGSGEVSDWISLEEITKAFASGKSNPEDFENTPIYTDNIRKDSTIFQSNIPLPNNPFLPSGDLMRSDSAYSSGSSSTESGSMEFFDSGPQTQQSEFYATDPIVPEQRLQKVLNKYLEELYKSKSSSDSTNSKSSFFGELSPEAQETSIEDPVSRADIFTRFKQSFIPTVQKSSEPVPQLASQFASSSHYTKPGSSSSFIPISIENSATAPVKSDQRIPLSDNKNYFQKIQTKESIEDELNNQYVSQSQITKLKRLQHLKEVFPPHGSYIPYGERTIVMVKYPGMPKSAKPNKELEIDLTLGWKNIWKPTSPSKAQPGSSDFGVIVTQNHILQPDTSSYTNNFAFDSSNNALNPSGDLVSQLAKALAERNRIINTYSTSNLSKGKKPIDTKPPFVLIHLESFTKKSNQSSTFGFDNVVEKNYANGTIIYPTKNDPSILASTKFEFETLDDVENIFSRPLEGYHLGAMKPIVPLGLADIMSYLKLMYEVHTDIHDGGKTKIDDLRKLSNSLERKSLPGSREMSDWEIKKSRGMLNDNWLHTSSIGLRSLSGDNNPFPQLPSRPIVTYGHGKGNIF